MNLHFFFFQLAPALNFIFKISYIPQDEDFKELTPEQYEAFNQRGSEEDQKNLANQKLFAFLPDDPKVSNHVFKLSGNNLFIVTEEEINAFASASALIDKCCSDSNHHFDSLMDKLTYLRQTMPDVFTEGTPYAIHGKRRK
ncbi:MAG: hypothetical protein HDR88_07730 [Bacteroides sp.]|nr:hypothetical protein [Bacteroides sp.]